MMPHEKAQKMRECTRRTEQQKIEMKDCARFIKLECVRKQQNTPCVRFGSVHSTQVLVRLFRQVRFRGKSAQAFLHCKCLRHEPSKADIGFFPVLTSSSGIGSPGRDHGLS